MKTDKEIVEEVCKGYGVSIGGTKLKEFKRRIGGEKQTDG